MNSVPQTIGRRLRATAFWILYAAFFIFATTFLLFALLEAFPALARNPVLQHVKYYAVRETYVIDPKLVFAYRGKRHLDLPFYGNSYVGDEGVRVPPVHYTASYNELGFRVNSSSPPFDAVVIGDSYIEIGEDDTDTFSERLKAASGMSTFNLGRAWYGPYQYLELYKRYGLALHPKYAIFCFFSGNDIRDIEEYKRWLNEGIYYSNRDPARVSFFRRYANAFLDSGEALFVAVEKMWLRRPGHGFNPDMGVFRLGNEDVRMKFDSDYWNPTETPQQLLSSDPWRELGTLIADFRKLSEANGITPVILYIPAAIQVYGRRFTGQGGSFVQEKMKNQVQFESNEAEASATLAAQNEIRYINLLPVFQCLAARGKLLYYPFDTHWNREGREAAAEYVAVSLGADAKKMSLLDGCNIAAEAEQQR
jgi:acetyltransferase AlgX (SGNH hydrolase-like protein)